MLGSSFVLSLSYGDVTLVKINQDGYSSEYLFRDTLVMYRLKIRHTTNKKTAIKPEYERHNIEIVRTTFATADDPEYYQKAYMVFEQKPDSTTVKLVEGLCATLIGKTPDSASNELLEAMVAWES